MIRSMTGFGRGEFSDGKRNVIAEIKTVNHRYADISIKMPKRYSFAEEKLKAIIKNQVKRGKVDVSIIVENLTEGDITISLNKPVADQYIERLRELKNGYDLEGEIDIKLLSSMPDVLKIIPDVADEEEVSSAICKAVELAAANLDEMREAGDRPAGKRRDHQRNRAQNQRTRSEGCHRVQRKDVQPHSGHPGRQGRCAGGENSGRSGHLR